MSSSANDLQPLSKVTDSSSTKPSSFFDPVAGFRNFPYNENSARELSAPAFYTNVCLSENWRSSLQWKNHTNKVNSVCLIDITCDDEDEGDDDDIIILEELSMPKAVAQNTKECTRMCQNDSHIQESHNILKDSSMNESSTNSVPPNIRQSGNEVQFNSPFKVSTFSGIPFLDGIPSNLKNCQSTSIQSPRNQSRAESHSDNPFKVAVFSEIPIPDSEVGDPKEWLDASVNYVVTSSAACDVDYSLDDDELYKASIESISEYGTLNFKGAFSKSLDSAALNNDSSVEVTNGVHNNNDAESVQKPANIDVIEIMDTDDENESTNLHQSSMVFACRIGNERIMPQLLPLGSGVQNHDENNNESISSSKEDFIEVIDVPSSPEMPKLIPFTSETEELPKIKKETSISSLKGHSFQPSSFSGLFQPKVVLKKLSFEVCNQKVRLENDWSPCYLDWRKLDDALTTEPDIDVIDGLNFYSFSSKTEMDTYWHKFSDSMLFQVDDDDLDSTETLSRDDSIIVPTKTTDITQIKGWRHKHFAPEIRSDEEMNIEAMNGVLNASEDFEMCNSEIMESHKENIALETSKVTNDLLNLPEISPCDKDDFGDLKLDKFNDCDKIACDIPPKERNNCAFVSAALDAYLNDESQLNVSILQKVNPNITPIPRGDSILSLGNLKKHDRENGARITKNESPKDSMKTEIISNHRTIDDVQSSPTLKVREKSSSVVASTKVLKKSRNFKNKSDSPISQRLVLRLRKENSGATHGYKVTKTTSEMGISPNKSSNNAILKKKLKSDSSVKETPILIRETLFSDDDKDRENELLNEFWKNINNFGTRNHCMLVNANQTYFTTPVITAKLASKSVSAVTSVDNLIEMKKQAGRLNVRQTHSASPGNKRKIVPSPKAKHITNSLFRSKSADIDANKGKGDCVTEIRGKRSIRLPARFLDSAILAAGTEWVSPVMSSDMDLSKKARKNNFQTKDSSAYPISIQNKVCSKIAPVISTDQEKFKVVQGASNAIFSSHQSFSSQGINKVANDDTVSKCKRITLSPNCMCKNTSRVMAYDFAEKRLRCSCIDSIIAAIKTSEGLTDLKDKAVNSPSTKNCSKVSYPNSMDTHNHAETVVMPEGTFSSMFTIENEVSLSPSAANATEMEDAQLHLSKEERLQQNSENSEEHFVNSNDSKPMPLALSGFNFKANTINIPGTNKYVSFVVVPKKSPPKLGAPLLAQNPYANSVKVSPTKSAVENLNIPLVLSPNASSTSTRGFVRLPLAKKPSIVVKNVSTSQTKVLPFISGVCSNQSETQNKESGCDAGCANPDGSYTLPLGSKPVVFSLSSESMMSKGEGLQQKLKSIEVMKDRVVTKTNNKIDPVLENIRKKNVCNTDDAQPTRKEFMKTNSLPVLPSNADGAVEGNKVSNNPRSQKSIKMVDKYILYPMVNANTRSHENIVTLHSAIDNDHQSLPKCSSPSVLPLTAKSNGKQASQSISPNSVTTNSATVIGQYAAPDNNCTMEPKSCVLYAESLSKVCSNSDQNSFLIDVESLDFSIADTPETFKDNSNSSFAQSAISSISSISNSDSSSEDEATTRNENSLQNNREVKVNRKSLLERHRRSTLRKHLDELRRCDPVLENKQSTIDLLNTATHVVNSVTADNFSLAMKVKMLLLRRQNLLKLFKKHAFDSNVVSRNKVMEILTMVAQSKRSRNSPSQPAASERLSPSHLFKMKKSLMEKMGNSVTSTPSSSELDGSDVYQLLKCNDKTLSSEEDMMISEDHSLDAGDSSNLCVESSKTNFTGVLSKEKHSSNSAGEPSPARVEQSRDESIAIPTSTSQKSLSVPLKRKPDSPSSEKGSLTESKRKCFGAHVPSKGVRRNLFPSQDVEKTFTNSKAVTYSKALNASDHSYISPNKSNEAKCVTTAIDPSDCSKQTLHQSLATKIPSQNPGVDVTKWYSSFGVPNHTNFTLKSRTIDNLASELLDIEPKAKRCASVVCGNDSVESNFKNLKKTLAESLAQGERTLEINKPLKSSHLEPPLLLENEQEEEGMSDFGSLVIDDSKCELKENNPCAVPITDVMST